MHIEYVPGHELYRILYDKSWAAKTKNSILMSNPSKGKCILETNFNPEYN